MYLQLLELMNPVVTHLVSRCGKLPGGIRKDGKEKRSSVSITVFNVLFHAGIENGQLQPTFSHFPWN